MPDEVVVADDGSGPETAAVVKQWTQALPCPVLHVWQEDSGFRLARSRNRAIAASTGEYIMLIDGDMILHPRFTADHIACARADCFIQGARPRLSPAATEQLLKTRVPIVRITSPGMEQRPYSWRSPLISRLTSKAKFGLGGIQGCNQSFWREHFLRVNGYDERFTGWGPEDKEFAARLLHIGVKRNYVRHRAIAWHLYHTSRAPEAHNPFDALMDETLRTRSVWAEHGVRERS